ncbi:unnamed protein product [Effrenium voratum]|nr:unnamed protein product [Effrenium voratum]
MVARLGALDAPLDLRLASAARVAPEALAALGTYRDLHPLRFNQRHVYQNDLTGHLLAYLDKSQRWALCWPRAPRHRLHRPRACKPMATYEALELERTLWHGGAGHFLTMPLPAGRQFFFNHTGFQPILAEFAEAPARVAALLRLGEFLWRPEPFDFFLADISRQVGFFERPVMNLWTMGSHFYQQAFADAPSAPCWGGGYLPQLCCAPRLSAERRSWCFGSDREIEKHCCGAFLKDRPRPKSIEAAAAAPAATLSVKVQIFVQSYHKDRFALVPFLESLDLFWPSAWNSTVFLAVDHTDSDRALCAELEARSGTAVRCIFPQAVLRRKSRVDSIEWSGRSVSKRYHRELLQYHYLLSDVYIEQMGQEADWVAWFDADVVLFRSPQPGFRGAKPLLFGRPGLSYSMATLALRLDWVAEFMDTFPIFVRPAHLRRFRGFLETSFQEPDFESAYQAWRVATEEAALVHARHDSYMAEGECPQSALPTYLYHFHREDYSWALEDGALFGLQPEDTCLGFRVASHLSPWKHKVKNGSWPEAEYVRRARRLMRLQQQNGASRRVALLSASFDPAATWSQRSSAHCEHDRESMLRREGDMEPDSEKEAILARRRLLLLLRQSPEVIRALQVSKRADDESILNALGKFESPFELLRQAGCSIPKASQAEELMALAVQAPKAKRKKRDKKMYFYAAAGCDVALIFLFVGLLAWQVTEATRGWTIGTCSLTLFTNQSCMQANGGCFVEVAVRSTDLYLVKQDWTLPVEHTGAEGVYTRYYGAEPRKFPLQRAPFPRKT